jgi:hypothetical protein
MTVQVGKFIEPVCRQMVAILTANLSTFMTTVMTEHSDDFVLDAIKKYHLGKVFVIDQIPAVVVWPESDNGGEYTSTTLYIESTITVWVVCNDSIQEQLQKKLWRYQDAIIRTLKATHNLDAQVDIYDFAGLRFDPPWLPMNENTYIGGAGVTFTVHHEEVL